MSNEEDNQVGHLDIGSHLTLHLDDDDYYINDDLVIGIPNVVMYNHFNDFEGLDADFDLDELEIGLDDIRDM